MIKKPWYRQPTEVAHSKPIILRYVLAALQLFFKRESTYPHVKNAASIRNRMGVGLRVRAAAGHVEPASGGNKVRGRLKKGRWGRKDVVKGTNAALTWPPPPACPDPWRTPASACSSSAWSRTACTSPHPHREPQWPPAVTACRGGRGVVMVTLDMQKSLFLCCSSNTKSSRNHQGQCSN